MTDLNRMRQLDPKALREYLKDGNWGGVYQRDDKEMTKVWQAGVEETRELLDGGWA
jgi:creatinine amidohydrolase